MRNFEKLEVWQKAIDFADLGYAMTRAFPAEERFGLTNRMRRAAVSISSNLAEGYSRSSEVDFGHFVAIATGSVFEVVSQAFIGRGREFLDKPGFKTMYRAAEEQSRMLSGLRKALLSK